MGDLQRHCQGKVQSWSNGKLYIAVTFDPGEAWGAKEQHRVTGSINGRPWRGPLEAVAGGKWVVSLGPAWLRDNELQPGDEVTVSLSPEGPQRDSLHPELAAALEAEPEAGVFFDSLATFYRKGYLRWLEGASRRPAVHTQRVRELVALLKAGKKTRE